MFHQWVVLNILKLWDTSYKVIWNLIKQFYSSATSVFFLLATDWEVVNTAVTFVTECLPHTPGFAHHPLLFDCCRMSSCHWYWGKTITSLKSFFSLALFPGFCVKELLNLLTCVSVQALDMASFPSIRHSILRSDRIIQELWKLWTR